MLNRVDAASILYNSYIRYDRMYEMTKFAFYGKSDSNTINVYVDLYSILRSLYSKGPSLQVNDPYAIASCIINLAIHIRAYFETRHMVSSKIYLVYGGARPQSALSIIPEYNAKNIVMEDSDNYIRDLIIDNLAVCQILCKYLYDIFCLVDMENEFNTIVMGIHEEYHKDDPTPNIIYGKDQTLYQLVAYMPRTFLYRPKKKLNQEGLGIDSSWVVTKSTLYNAYRYGELGIKKQYDTKLPVAAFGLYQTISGLRSRNIPSIKNANTSIKLLEDFGRTTIDGVLSVNELFKNDPKIDPELVLRRFATVNLSNQYIAYSQSPYRQRFYEDLVNLYDPQEVRNINDNYFIKYPIDLNRV